MAARQLEVQIMGQSYLLACPDGGEAALRDAVGRVDAAMCRIRDAGKVRARDRIAVLAALNIAFDSQGATPAPGVAAATSATSAPTEGSADDEAIVRALMARIDTALGEDGRLI